LNAGMTKMDKNRKKSRGHSSREPTDMQDQEMDIRKIMKDVENFSNVHFPSHFYFLFLLLKSCLYLLFESAFCC